MVKQIAGRAGRFGKSSEPGMVTCLNPQDIKYLTKSLETPNEPLRKCIVFPTKEQFIMANTLSPSTFLHQLLHQLRELTLFSDKDSLVQMAEISTKIEVAEMLKKYQKRIAFPDLLNIINAPLKRDDDSQKMSFFYYLSQIANETPCPVRIKIPSISSSNPSQALITVESLYQTLDLYLWMAGQFPHIFLEREEAENRKRECGEIVEKFLDKLCAIKRKRKRMATFTTSPITFSQDDDIVNDGSTTIKGGFKEFLSDDSKGFIGSDRIDEILRDLKRKDG